MQRKAGSSGRHRRAVPGQAESVQRVSKSVFLPIIIRRKSLAFRFFPDSGNCSRQAPEKGILSHHVLPRQVRTGAENTTSSNRVFKCPSIAAAANLPCPAGNRLWRPSCCPSAVRASAMLSDGFRPHGNTFLISHRIRRQEPKRSRVTQLYFLRAHGHGAQVYCLPAWETVFHIRKRNSYTIRKATSAIIPKTEWISSVDILRPFRQNSQCRSFFRLCLFGAAFIIFTIDSGRAVKWVNDLRGATNAGKQADESGLERYPTCRKKVHRGMIPVCEVVLSKCCTGVSDLFTVSWCPQQ